jgi:hypothetical protein
MPLPQNAQTGGALDPSKDLVITGQIVSAGTATSGGIGYTQGAGAVVTQLTNRTTAVTINALCGTITTNNTSLAAEAAASFTVNNAAVAVGDVVVLSQRGGAVGVMTTVEVIATAAGSFTIAVMNGNAAAGTAETGAIQIGFVVIKASTN